MFKLLHKRGQRTTDGRKSHGSSVAEALLSLVFDPLLEAGILHGPSMFAVRAKIYGVLYNQAAQSLLMKHLVIGQR